MTSDLNSHREEVEVTIRRYSRRLRRLIVLVSITLMIIRKNKVKKRHIFERFGGFKMSVEGGSVRRYKLVFLFYFILFILFYLPH